MVNSEDSTPPGPPPPIEPPPMRAAREIYDGLQRYVIGQDEAARAVAVAATTHLKRVNAMLSGRPTLLRKSNILLIGPTGCGKTHLARTLADLLGVGMITVDATEYTEAGYYGKDVEVMVAELLFHNELDVAATERGIIFIDEVDKLARRGEGMRTGAGSRDIGGEGVQQALLKLLEGRTIFVPLNVTQHWNKHDFVQIDTRHILFILAGTFSDLWDDPQQRGVGFESDLRPRPRRRLTRQDLAAFGMLPEFLGRVPSIVQLNLLDEDALRAILTDPPDAITKEYTELFAHDDVELSWTSDGVMAVAHYAYVQRLGARALRGIIEAMLRDHLFDAPQLAGQRITVDSTFVQSRLAAADVEGSMRIIS